MRITLKAIPRSRESSLTQQPDGTWVARLKAPPVDGKANAEVIALVAEHFGVPKRCVTIRSGETGRRKVVEVRD